MDRLLTTIKWALVGWGAVSLIFCLWSLAVFMASFGDKARPLRQDQATVDDVQFVLDRCRLGSDRIQSVPHSYESARPLSGSYQDVYAIKLSHLNLDELTSTPDQAGLHWYRGDRLPSVVGDAVSVIGQTVDEQQTPWFPSENELTSNKLYTYPWRMDYEGTRLIAASVIFIRPSDQTVFYVDFKR